MNALSKAAHGLAGPATVSPYRRLSPNLLQAIGLLVWGGLESFARRRAMRELDALAERWQSTDPELAHCLRTAVDDCGFAADEYAAADRPRREHAGGR